MNKAEMGRDFVNNRTHSESTVSMPLGYYTQ